MLKCYWVWMFNKIIREVIFSYGHVPHLLHLPINVLVKFLGPQLTVNCPILQRHFLGTFWLFCSNFFWIKIYVVNKLPKCDIWAQFFMSPNVLIIKNLWQIRLLDCLSSSYPTNTWTTTKSGQGGGITGESKRFQDNMTGIHVTHS